MQIIKNTFKRMISLSSHVIVPVMVFLNNRLLKGNRNFFRLFLANLYFKEQLVFKIKPVLIKYHVSDPDVLPENLFVWAGDWDKRLITIDKHEKIIMVRELFLENKDYRETAFYSFAVNRMKENRPVKRGVIMLDSPVNIDRYFEKHKKIFYEIKNQGFDINRSSKIGVAIGRDGKLIHFREGHHTLAIAKILGINEIKIKIRAVHSEWLFNQLSGSKLDILSTIKNSLNKLFQ